MAQPLLPLAAEMNQSVDNDAFVIPTRNRRPFSWKHQSPGRSTICAG